MVKRRLVCCREDMVEVLKRHGETYGKCRKDMVERIREKCSTKDVPSCLFCTSTMSFLQHTSLRSTMSFLYLSYVQSCLFCASHTFHLSYVQPCLFCTSHMDHHVFSALPP